MAGYQVGIASETKAFKQGVETGIIEPLEDAQRELLNLGKSKGPEQLEAEMRGAQTATEKLSDETKKTADDIEREYKRAYREAREASDDGVGKMKAGAQELQSEVGQNMGEAFSSFRGELEDIGQIGQDTLGGLAGTVSQMGPAGIVAGAGLGVAAGAVGLVADSFTKAKEASDEAKESAYEYGLTVAESGKFADTAARINELTGSIEGLKQVQDIATVSGWAQKDVLTAMATGDGLPALTKAFDEGANSTLVATGRVNELQGALDGTAQGFDLATGAADLNASALYDLATKAGKATGDVDYLNRTIVEMPDGKRIVIDAATEQAHEEIDAVDSHQPADKTVKVNADTSDWDAAVNRIKAAGITVNGNIRYRTPDGRYLE
jgi:hypothetical protein